LGINSPIEREVLGLFPNSLNQFFGGQQIRHAPNVEVIDSNYNIDTVSS
jgi:hypothetical protein